MPDGKGSAGGPENFLEGRHQMALGGRIGPVRVEEKSALGRIVPRGLGFRKMAAFLAPISPLTLFKGKVYFFQRC